MESPEKASVNLIVEIFFIVIFICKNLSMCFGRFFFFFNFNEVFIQCLRERRHFYVLMMIGIEEYYSVGYTVVPDEADREIPRHTCMTLSSQDIERKKRREEQRHVILESLYGGCGLWCWLLLLCSL